MNKCECKSQEQNKEVLETKLKEFEQLKANVSFLAGQIALLQELVKCTCDGDCSCQTG
jgi:cell division protein FtsB